MKKFEFLVYSTLGSQFICVTVVLWKKWYNKNTDGHNVKRDNSVFFGIDQMSALGTTILMGTVAFLSQAEKSTAHCNI